MRMVNTTVYFGGWNGTPLELFEKCRAEAEDAGELAIFPRAANTFTARLREATQALSEHGIRVESGKSDKRRWVRISRDVGRDDATPEPSRRDDAGTTDRPGQSRDHSGNASIRDGRDDASDDLYGGTVLRSKGVEDESTLEAGSVHPGHRTVPTVPAPTVSDGPRAAHAYDYSRRAYTTGGKLACGRQGSDVADYRIVDAHSPDDAANMVITDGLQAAVAVAKRAGIPNARTYVEDAFRRWAERGAVSAGTKIIEAQGFDPTPANNAGIDWRPVFAAEAEFVIRRIAELRRDGRTREARALRQLLPERIEWREWIGTLTERDRRLIAEAETLATAARKMIEQGGVSPFAEGAEV